MRIRQSICGSEGHLEKVRRVWSPPFHRVFTGGWKRRRKWDVRMRPVTSRRGRGECTPPPPSNPFIAPSHVTSHPGEKEGSRLPPSLFAWAGRVRLEMAEKKTPMGRVEGEQCLSLEPQSAESAYSLSASAWELGASASLRERSSG